jgi:2-polyprenyl-3-methyl-5-hydroxy-6-metoxy-1,4-benzoquinol methylase
MIVQCRSITTTITTGCYHRLLLRQLPPGCRTALDVGCGTGRFAGRLAQRGLEVDAVDRSAEVLAAARGAPAPPAGRVRYLWPTSPG